MAAIGHPIVGDGKYGGQDSFLTGSISRKMHLHARRLVIDHPEGDQIDVTAPLPEHFAATMEQMGFHEEDGAIVIEASPPGPSREVKKRAAKAHAKQYRKERRGERRGRGASADDSKKPFKKPSKNPGKVIAGKRPPKTAGHPARSAAKKPTGKNGRR